MNAKKGSQLIKCDVGSCKFFKDQMCGLDSIQVSPCTHINNGKPEDETLCSSYSK